MADTALVESDLAAGKELVLLLDGSDFPIFAALWLLRQESTDWILFIGSEEVDKVGKHEAYARLQKIMAKNGAKVPLSEISLVGTSDRFLSLISGAIAVDGVSEVRFQNSMINGVLIPDALIYRLQRPSTTPQDKPYGSANRNASNAGRTTPKPTKRTNAPSPKRHKR